MVVICFLSISICIALPSKKYILVFWSSSRFATTALLVGSFVAVWSAIGCNMTVVLSYGLLWDLHVCTLVQARDALLLPRDCSAASPSTHSRSGRRHLFASPSQTAHAKERQCSRALHILVQAGIHCQLACIHC